jgi:hypothetical protein
MENAELASRAGAGAEAAKEAGGSSKARGKANVSATGIAEQGAALGSEMGGKLEAPWSRAPSWILGPACGAVV